MVSIRWQRGKSPPHGHHSVQGVMRTVQPQCYEPRHCLGWVGQGGKGEEYRSYE